MKDRFNFRFWHKLDKKMQDWKGSLFWQALNNNNLIPQQCTGLKDKNSKLIYEGDILWVLCTESHIGVVCWDNEKAYYRINGKGVAYNVLQVLHSEFAFEVIGNIYENPELLEVDIANIQP